MELPYRGRDRFYGYRQTVSSPIKNEYNVLDQLSQAATAAYSFRKVNDSYTGSCVELVRNSDSVSDCFGFNAYGLLDTEAIADWLGGGTAVVKHWYDQSGNGNDLYQDLGSNRPGYSETGLLNKPTLDFDGNDYLSLTSSVLIADNAAYTTIFLGYKTAAANNLWCFAGATGGCSLAGQYSGGSGKYIIDYSDTSAYAQWETPSYGVPAIFGSKRSTSESVTHYYNTTSNSTGTMNGAMTITGIGVRSSTYTTGYISETFLFSSELSSEDIDILRNNINVYYEIY